VVAFAANRDRLAHLDYALFDKQILSELNIKFEKSPGDTPDEEANSNWHIDLVELTASKRLELAMTIMAKAEKNRLQQKIIQGLILEAVTSEQISLDKIRSEKLQTKIQTLIS
jgi:hypothetical protein